MIDDHLEVRLESEHFDTSKAQLHKLEGREGISRLFQFDLEIVSTDPSEPGPDAMAGADASLVFLRDGEEVRRVHGMIAEVDEMFETEVETRVYRLKLVPRAFRLTLVETQEIYMDLSVPDIIKQKLELVGLGADDVEFRLLDKYPPLEFVVQYRESDLAFISRLCEHLGLSFFFTHEDRDKIVFTDQNWSFAELAAPGPVIPFRARGEKRDVYRVEAKTRLVPALYAVQDYNYRTPHVDLTSSAEVTSGFAGGVVEYAPHVKTPETAAALARIRAEERASGHRVYTCESATCQLGAGLRFKLEGHPRFDDIELLVIEIEHRLSQPTLTHGGEKPEYANSLRAVDTRLPYRSPRITPRPRIYGVLTGVVEQEPDIDLGQYAKLDTQGRYTVRFLFDTTAPGERKASRPVRMIQPHVGPDYGMHFPLKPGIEVLLVFIDGDPDRPLIVGAVPNPETPSPVTRASALMNRLKTASGVILEMKDL